MSYQAGIIEQTIERNYKEILSEVLDVIDLDYDKTRDYRSFWYETEDLSVEGEVLIEGIWGEAGDDWITPRTMYFDGGSGQIVTLKIAYIQPDGEEVTADERIVEEYRRRLTEEVDFFMRHNYS